MGFVGGHPGLSIVQSRRTFAEFESATYMEVPQPKFRKYLQKGFATPSSKVELA